jgi:hypothetical protein
VYLDDLTRARTFRRYGLVENEYQTGIERQHVAGRCR